MPEYFHLFAVVCDVIDELELLKARLIQAALRAESLHISGEISLQDERPD